MKVYEGNDFIKLVKEICCNIYHYELQDLPVWPMEPGHRTPALPKPLLKQWEEEQKAK